MPFTNNRILSALARSGNDRILAASQQFAMRAGDVLVRGDDTDHVYFIESGLVSVQAVSGDRAIEVALVGPEGMVGLGVMLGQQHQWARAVCLTDGRARWAPTASVLDSLVIDPELSELLRACAQSVLAQAAHWSACRRLHSNTQQCARWLLHAHDRVQYSRLRMTQSRIADLLGTRRVSVTNAATELKRGGCIDYARGSIAVLDRGSLERAACACYRAVREAESACERVFAMTRYPRGVREAIQAPRVSLGDALGAEALGVEVLGEALS